MIYLYSLTTYLYSICTKWCSHRLNPHPWYQLKLGTQYVNNRRKSITKVVVFVWVQRSWVWHLKKLSPITHLWRKKTQIVFTVFTLMFYILTRIAVYLYNAFLMKSGGSTWCLEDKSFFFADFLVTVGLHGLLHKKAFTYINEYFIYGLILTNLVFYLILFFSVENEFVFLFSTILK